MYARAWRGSRTAMGTVTSVKMLSWLVAVLYETEEGLDSVSAEAHYGAWSRYW